MFILNMEWKEWYIEVVKICKIYMQNKKKKKKLTLFQSHTSTRKISTTTRAKSLVKMEAPSERTLDQPPGTGSYAPFIIKCQV